MKITVIIAFNPFFINSATSNRWLSLLDGLSSQNASICLLIYGGYNSENERNQWKTEGSYKSIYYHYLSKSLNNSYLKRRFKSYFLSFFQSKNLIRKMCSLINNENNLIWTDTTIFSFKLVCHIKRNLPHIKIFTELSEFLDIHKFNKGNILQKIKGDFRKFYFEQKAFSKYDLIVLMTLTLIRHYQLFPKHVPVLFHLPMTVDLERFNGSKDILDNFKPPYIAFVGVMDDKKDGVSILIEAFNKIKDQYPSHSVYLVGGWNYDTPNHLKLINEYNLTDRVHWMKEYPRDLIPNIICNADLLVLPRPDSKQAQGGFPTKLGEYLASGVPVCATTVGEIPDYLVDNESVFFTEPGSVESFADAMNRALSDPLNAKRVGLNGKAVAEKDFNKDIQAKKLYDFLKTL